MPGTSPYSSVSKHQEARGLPGLLAPMPFLRRAWDAGLDLIFPPRCAGCGRVDSLWCGRCQARLDATPEPEHIQPLPPLTAMAATALHDGIVQRAIWSLKYENARTVAIPLGERLAAYLDRAAWPVTCVMPVPMHADRLAQRGYNQAQLLAAVLAACTETPCIPEALRRWRYTPSQVGLGREARLANVQEAFAADTTQVSGRVILLVDDVYTTGATLSACAQTLLDAGATAVYGLTVSAARHSFVYP